MLLRQQQRFAQLSSLNRRLFTTSSDALVKRSGIYAGSFDPPTSGHLDIIQRGTNLCDKLYVGIAINTAKKPIFSVEHRERLLHKITNQFGQKVEIVRVEGLLADYVEQNNINFFVRGIRSFSDFDSEFTMGIINRRLAQKETIFLQASSSRVHISSSLIRELAMYETKLDRFVPAEIEDEVYSHLFDHHRKQRELNGQKQITKPTPKADGTSTSNDD